MRLLQIALLVLAMMRVAAAVSEFATRQPLVLIGDSITEAGFNGGWAGWAALLSDHVRLFREDGKESIEIQRDVINRGYSGYTTRSFIPMLKDILESTQTKTYREPALTTIFLGANDASQSPAQHVPIQEYTENLYTFAKHYLHTYPTSKLLFITPPAPVCECEYDHGRMNILPINHDYQNHTDGRMDASFSLSSTSHIIGSSTTTKTLYKRPWQNSQNYTRVYRDRVLAVVRDLNGKYPDQVGVMDTWEMMFGVDSETGSVVYDRDVADGFYIDGLHYNAKGDFLHYQHLVAVVQRLWPSIGL
ncbi:SGNH hydrolase-type esterase domain-containing protein [Obelidium mucronatum]|nr:SGNH hydrolase-type esterase domain-containing protein [Obelidium mucronatum]